MEKGPKKIFRAFGPKTTRVQKLGKNVVFWLKKCENFRIRHPIIFFLKKFSSHQCGRKSTFHQKAVFSKGNSVLKKNKKTPKSCKKFSGQTHTQKKKNWALQQSFWSFFFFNYFLNYFFIFFLFFLYFFYPAIFCYHFCFTFY